MCGLDLPACDFQSDILLIVVGSGLVVYISFSTYRTVVCHDLVHIIYSYLIFNHPVVVVA